MNDLDNQSLNRGGFSFRDIIGQDRWETTWTPTRTSWTDVGSPTVTARHRIVGRQCFFQIKVVPSTSIATTAGTSYTNLPIAAKGLGGDASMVNLTTNVAVGTAVIDAANSRCYPPSQAASGNTFLIAGWFEV